MLISHLSITLSLKVTSVVRTAMTTTSPELLEDLFLSPFPILCFHRIPKHLPDSYRLKFQFQPTYLQFETTHSLHQSQLQTLQVQPSSQWPLFNVSTFLSCSFLIHFRHHPRHYKQNLERRGNGMIIDAKDATSLFSHLPYLPCPVISILHEMKNLPTLVTVITLSTFIPKTHIMITVNIISKTNHQNCLSSI